MDQRGGVEHDRDREKLPERGVVIDAVGQRVHRDIAERMIEEMADQIGEQHHPQTSRICRTLMPRMSFVESFLGE